MNLLLKNSLVFLLFLLLSCSSKEKEINDFYRLTNSPILTEDLLERLNKDEFTEENKGNPIGHIVSLSSDSLLQDYAYREIGDSISFDLISFGGKVLEFKKYDKHSLKESQITYFDKNIWHSYLKEKLPNLPNEFKIDKNESSEILKSYYKFIGMTNFEYGWICEYGTIGMLTEKRREIITIVRLERMDLLRKLIEYPDIYVQLYTSDAMIYIDNKYNQKIERQIELIKKYQPDATNEDIENDWRINEFKKMLITKKEQNIINDLINNQDTIFTCGNSGSYKLYKNTPANLISNKMIPEIVNNYEYLFENHQY